MPLAQVLGNLNLWASVPAVVFYYLFYSSFDFNDPEGFVTDTTTFLNEYDFIVIGAGSTGSVVANRLTEVNDWKVLLLEAGGDETIFSDIPGVVHHLQRTNIDWSYKTVPQSGSCLAFKENKCTWPRGKVLGGTSVLNYMVYARGNKNDYDSWAVDNPGWSYDEVLPYFIKSEDNRNPYIAANKKYHGTGGYLTVQEPAYKTPLVTAFLEGGVEMGYENRDCNAAKQTGFMIAQATNRRGARCSTAKAFLRPIRKRPNLSVSMHSMVHKIVIDPTTKQAVAVRFEKRGKIYQVKAKKEIILSAGTVNSPQLLMLSGVGHVDHLNSLGIPLMADLPVGDNLQDHIALGGMVFRMDKPYGVTEARYYSLSTFLNYTINAAGPLTSLGGTEGVAWIKTKYAPDGDWPDIQYHFVSATPASESGLFFRYNTGVKDDIWNSYYQPIVNKDMWQLIPTLLRPLSRGTIRLASNDPYAAPVIDPKYFSDEKGKDLKVLIEGTKFALALSKTEAFQKLGSRFYDKIFPGCEDFTPWTDDYWGCFIRHYSSAIYHMAGTCKMGPDAQTAVVDSKLRVHGIKSLRVADCSIMPNVVSGNTNVPAIMIGEKVSDMIKATWMLRDQEEDDNLHQKKSKGRN